MSSSKTKGGAVLQKDVPWRAANAPKPIPKIHHSPVLRLPQTPFSDYALYVMEDSNPIGNGLAKEAMVESAGPDCIVPGQIAPIKLLGLKGKMFFELTHTGQSFDSLLVLVFYRLCQIWPIELDLKFAEPVGRELKNIGKFMDSAVDLMNKSFIDR